MKKIYSMSILVISILISLGGGFGLGCWFGITRNVEKALAAKKFEQVLSSCLSSKFDKAIDIIADKYDGKEFEQKMATITEFFVSMSDEK